MNRKKGHSRASVRIVAMELAAIEARCDPALTVMGGSRLEVGACEAKEHAGTVWLANHCRRRTGTGTGEPVNQ
jgi:hypothetical protein